MVNLCARCGGVINEGDQVEMMVEGTYHLIPSVNSFRLDKDIVFKTGTLSHQRCNGEE